MTTKLTYDSRVIGYVTNYLTRHYWRIASTMTWEDAQQEACIVFLRVQAKYPDVEAPHLMALFKTAWNNEFNDLSTKNSEMAEFASSMPDGYEGQCMGSTDNDGILATKIRQAPSEVRAVLNLFFSAPQELFELAVASWRGADKRCKTGGSKSICKMLGIDEKVDVLKMTHDYFSE